MTYYILGLNYLKQFTLLEACFSLDFQNMLKYTSFRNIHVVNNKAKRITCTKGIYSYYLQNYYNVTAV